MSSWQLAHLSLTAQCCAGRTRFLAPLCTDSPRNQHGRFTCYVRQCWPKYSDPYTCLFVCLSVCLSVRRFVYNSALWIVPASPRPLYVEAIREDNGAPSRGTPVTMMTRIFAVFVNCSFRGFSCNFLKNSTFHEWKTICYDRVFEQKTHTLSGSGTHTFDKSKYLLQQQGKHRHLTSPKLLALVNHFENMLNSWTIESVLLRGMSLWTYAILSIPGHYVPTSRYPHNRKYLAYRSAGRGR